MRLSILLAHYAAVFFARSSQVQNLVVVSSTAMSETHEDRQYIPAMKLMGDEVDARFDPKYVLGEAGHRFCQTYSVRAAHPEFPYALHCLSMMCALVNGARVAVFPTSQSPLVAINVNYAQTRKPSMTGHAETLGQTLDAVILKAVESRLEESLQSRQCKMDCQVGLPEGFEGRAYTLFVDEMFDPCNALTLCKSTAN